MEEEAGSGFEHFPLSSARGAGRAKGREAAAEGNGHRQRRRQRSHVFPQSAEGGASSPTCLPFGSRAPRTNDYDTREGCLAVKREQSRRGRRREDGTGRVRREEDKMRHMVPRCPARPPNQPPSHPRRRRRSSSSSGEEGGGREEGLPKASSSSSSSSSSSP